MFCLKCGKEIENGVKFCPYCGAVTAAGSNAAGNTPPVNTAPEADGVASWSAPTPEGKKRRGSGLIIGGAVAAVLVVAAVIAAVSGLFRTPKGQVEKALGKTISAYASAREKMGAPDLKGLVQSGSYSQEFRMELDSVGQDLSGWYDLSAMKGLGVRVVNDYDQKGRKMDADIALFWDDKDLMSFQMLVDGNTMSFASPDFTKGAAYGFNTETIGADLDALGADGGEVDLKKIGFNVFDLVEKTTPSEEQTKEMEKIMADAYAGLIDAFEVEKAGKENVQVNGKGVNATLYHVVIPKGAMKDYINAMEDAMKVVDANDMLKDVFLSMGFDKDTVNQIMSDMGDADVYGEIAYTLKEAVKVVGDVELDVYISGGYVSAVEYSDRIEGSKVEIGLYLGGGQNYVDDFSMEITIDGEKLAIESSGDHAGKSGVFTDETVIRVDSGRITSELRYEPKADKDNFEWNLKVDNSGSLNVEGQLTTTKNSVDLRLDDLSLKVAGNTQIALKASYYLGPCGGVKVSISSPKMLADMDQDDLLDLLNDLEDNAMDWAYDLENRLPPDLYYGLF